MARDLKHDENLRKALEAAYRNVAPVSAREGRESHRNWSWRPPAPEPSGNRQARRDGKRRR